MALTPIGEVRTEQLDIVPAQLRVRVTRRPRYVYDLLVGTVLSSPKVFADDTTLPVLEPGRGRTKTGRLWCYAVDDRPWNGSGHPVAVYAYSEDRKGERPAGHLAPC